MDEAKNFMLGMMQTLKERIGNPFIGAFAAAWFVWNFKIVLVIAGKGPWDAKIKYIYTDLMKDWTDWAVHGYLIPSIVAALWIFLLPPAFRWVTVWHEKQLNKSRKAIYGVTEQRVLTEDEAVILRTHILEEKTKLLDEKEKFSKSLTDHALEIQRLNNELKTIESERQKANEENKALNNEMAEAKIQIEKFNDQTKQKFFHLDFATVGITDSRFKEELKAIGFRFEPRYLSNDEQIVRIHDNYNHWPLITNGITLIGNSIVLPEKEYIDESCAAIIIVADSLIQDPTENILPFDEFFDALQLMNVPNIFTSIEHLITIRFLSYNDETTIFRVNPKLYGIASQFKRIGFRINQQRLSGKSSLSFLAPWSDKDIN